MAKKHQYKIGSSSTRRKAGRKWRHEAKQRLIKYSPLSVGPKRTKQKRKKQKEFSSGELPFSDEFFTPLKDQLEKMDVL